MNLVKKTLFILVVAAVMIQLSTADAHAYIDPASGSYFLQILLAGLLGALFTLKIYWKKIKSGLSRLIKRRSRHNDDTV